MSPTFSMLERVGTEHELFSITPLHSIRQKVKVLTKEWSDSIVDNYFETIQLSKEVSGAFKSNKCHGPVRFRAFYQPYQVQDDVKYMHEKIRDRVRNVTYAVDVFGAYDKLGSGVYGDVVHVKQDAHPVMAKRIASSLLGDKDIAKCF